MIEPETANAETPERRESQTSLKQLAFLFFKLGVISFGGPAAHVAMMEDEVVRRRRWLSHGGSVLFGSGYVLLAFLRADLVERWRWLTESQLLDAVTAGQAPPGPVFTTATFIGYVLGGLPGALVATVGIFLPAFFFVAVSGPLVSRIRRSATAGAVLDGINAASLSLMAVVTWRLGRAAVVNRSESQRPRARAL